MNRGQKIILILLSFSISLWLIKKSISQDDLLLFILGAIFLFISIVVLAVLIGKIKR